MSAVVHHVGLGMVRVTGNPGSLRAIVGPGYVLAVVTRDLNFAGMAHLQADQLTPESTRQRVDRLLDRLVMALERLGARVRGSRAEVIGGADILKIFPGSSRDENTQRFIQTITAAVEARGMRLTRQRVGGARARRIWLTLPGGKAEIDVVTPNNRAQRQRRPASDAPPEPRRDYEREVTVNMGCLAVDVPPKQLVAILGSCVGLALFDPTTGIGGLAHIMLPHQDRRNGKPGKFADTALPALLTALERAGANRKKVVAKIVGGASVMLASGEEGIGRIGRTNVEVTREALSEAGIHLLWEDTGGERGRRVVIDLDGFDVRVKMLERVGVAV